MQSLRPPIFQKPFPVWGGYRASPSDQGAIQAGMALERSRQSRTNLGRVFREVPDRGSGLETDDFPVDSLIPAGCMVGVGNPYMLISDMEYTLSEIEYFTRLQTFATSGSG